MALAMVSKERFFCFFASKRVGAEDGRRGTMDVWGPGQLCFYIYKNCRLTSRVAMGKPEEVPWAGILDVKE